MRRLFNIGPTDISPVKSELEIVFRAAEIGRAKGVLIGHERVLPAFRDGVVSEALFNQQQSALSVAVEGIYGVEQALTLDQPRLVVLIDVEHEHEILCFEVAADR